MSLKESEALVLKSYNLSESDRIVVFFTRSFGVVRGVAKGARRLTSKFGSSLEPFSTVHLSYFQKEERELVSIQNTELVSSRFETVADVDFLETFSYIAELLIDFSPPHEADETLYRMINACLGAATAPGALPAVTLYFEVWLLKLSGYLPDWSSCVGCGRGIPSTEPAAVVEGFHLRCDDCRARFTLMALDAADVALFRSILRLPPAEFSSSNELAATPSDKVSAIIRRMIAHALGRDVAASPGLR